MYVGKSGNVHGRWKSHAKTAPLYHPDYLLHNKVVDLCTLEVEISINGSYLKHFIPSSMYPDVGLHGDLITLAERVLIEHFDAELNAPTDRNEG